MFLEWSEDIAVGIENIDNQHKNLFSVLSFLYETVSKGLERSAISKVFNELIDYTVEHFETEEKSFKQYNFPGAENHIKDHNDLTRQVVKLQEDFQTGKITISFDILDFLHNWLVDHTAGVDMEYSKFLKENRII